MAIYTSQYPPAFNGTYVKSTSCGSPGVVDAFYATNPAGTLYGNADYASWFSSTSTDQRFHIDLGSPKNIVRIYLENFINNLGSQVNRGVQNFTFWGSNTESDFLDLTYSNDGTWVQLNTEISIWAMHTSVEQSEPQYSLVTNVSSYRYYAFKFPDNYGGSVIGVRRIELQTENVGTVTYTVITESGSDFPASFPITITAV